MKFLKRQRFIAFSKGSFKQRLRGIESVSKMVYNESNREYRMTFRFFYCNPYASVQKGGQCDRLFCSLFEIVVLDDSQTKRLSETTSRTARQDQNPNSLIFSSLLLQLWPANRSSRTSFWMCSSWLIFTLMRSFFFPAILESSRCARDNDHRHRLPGFSI